MERRSFKCGAGAGAPLLFEMWSGSGSAAPILGGGAGAGAPLLLAGALPNSAYVS